MSQSIESKIFNRIKKCGRGNLLFAPDFIRYGEQKSVNKVLERMMAEEKKLCVSATVLLIKWSLNEYESQLNLRKP
jgi:hypothetical protein